MLLALRIQLLLLPLGWGRAAMKLRKGETWQNLERETGLDKILDIRDNKIGGPQ